MATISITEPLKFNEDPQSVKNFEELVNNPKYTVDLSDPKYNKVECKPENMKVAAEKLCKRLSN